MFGYTFKQLPAKYLFGGYSVRKSYTIMTRVEDGKVIYDTFLLTYMYNYLSFYILMDNGKYKNVSLNKEQTIMPTRTIVLLTPHSLLPHSPLTPR